MWVKKKYFIHLMFDDDDDDDDDRKHFNSESAKVQFASILIEIDFFPVVVVVKAILIFGRKLIMFLTTYTQRERERERERIRFARKQ